MDPIHPIVPVQPNIPSVTPAPNAGRVDRDGARGNPGQDRRRRKAPDVAPAAHASVGGSDYYLEDPGDDDDTGLHISVTA